MFMRTCHWLFAVLLMPLLLGCGGAADESSSPEVPQAGHAVEPAADDAPPSPAPPGQTEQPADDSGDAAAENVNLQILDWESTLALVQEQDAEVVVMDLWSTTCPPCREEFPELVRLHKEHPGRVACISVSVDYTGLGQRTVEDYRDKVLAFLRQQQADFNNVLLSTDAETLFNSKLKHGSVPVVYVFNRQGEIVGEFPDPNDPGEFTYREQILPLVKKLLAQGE